MGNEQKKEKKLQNLIFFAYLETRKSRLRANNDRLLESRVFKTGQETEIMGLRLEPEASANSQFVDLANIFLVPTWLCP